MDNLTAQSISDCSYTDFIGIVNQTNVPPGAYSTITEWAMAGAVNANSHVVEVACTTGFSLREMASQTGCSGEGVDLSERSVRRAAASVCQNPAKFRIEFSVGDATEFKPKKQPSHVIIGAALGFFPQPSRMLSQIERFFTRGHGLLLASPFYCTQEFPEDLLADAKRVLNITPTRTDYKATMSVYQDFKIRYENRRTLVMETNRELKHYCQSTVERASLLSSEKRGDVLEAMYHRLFEIRDVTNRLRPHQAYSVLVLDYDESDHGARYVELF